ncbi:MAG: PQQ-binding-like beta-propeller repeat protein, partial [Planctomycetota bacterium]
FTVRYPMDSPDAVDFVDGYDAAVPEWGFSGSPMIADGKLIVPVGGKDATLVALEPATGKLIWKAKGSGMGYASPVIGTLGGVVQVVTYDDYGVNGWELKTGKKLWAIEPEEAWDYSVPSPLLVNGKLLTVHSSWAQLFEFKDGGKINDEPIATNEDVYTEMDTPVLLGDKVLASGGGLFLLDPEKKLKVLWKDYDNELYLSGMTHIIAGKDKALVFSEPGNVGLVTLQADGKLKLEGTRKLADKTWAAPAMMDGRIFIRDSKKLYCYPVKTEAIKPAKASE